MELKEFERQFKALYLPLGMYALRLVDDSDVAEDLVQDAFLKAWEEVESGAEIQNFKAWMYGCVRNRCIDFLRRETDTVGLEAYGDVAEEDVDNSVRDARVWKAIDSLPDKCREIFLMSKRDGMSNEEIAEELGLSVKTVKNQMTKAFSRLRDALDGKHKPFFLPFL